MSLLKRLGYYLGGFSVGLVILAFFLNGKKVSCDYGPEARVKKKLLNKTIVLSPEELNQFSHFKLDSVSVREFIKSGSIYFSESEPRKEPCGIYDIRNTIGTTKLSLKVENCETTATILHAVKLN